MLERGAIITVYPSRQVNDLVHPGEAGTGLSPGSGPLTRPTMSASPNAQSDQTAAGNNQRDGRVDSELAYRSGQAGQRFEVVWKQHAGIPSGEVPQALEGKVADRLRRSALIGFARR